MTPTTTEITIEQATHLAALIEHIRPDWPSRQTIQLIGQHRTEHPLNRLAIAAIQAANEPTNRSPSIIFMPGKHWNIPDHTPAGPPPDPCQDHPEEPAHNCRCCWADVKTGHRPQTHIGKHHEPQEEA